MRLGVKPEINAICTLVIGLIAVVIVFASLASKLSRARGESAALRNLANAAKMIEDNPNLLQLRALQVLGESGGNTLFFGVPSGAVVQPGKSGNGNKPTNE